MDAVELIEDIKWRCIREKDYCASKEELKGYEKACENIIKIIKHHEKEQWLKFKKMIEEPG